MHNNTKHWNHSPLTPDAAIKLPGCKVALLLGMELVQSTIDEEGWMQAKHRLTLDQIFSHSGEKVKASTTGWTRQKLMGTQSGKP